MKPVLSMLLILLCINIFGQDKNKHILGVELQTNMGIDITYQYCSNQYAFQIEIHPTNQMNQVPFAISSFVKRSAYTYKRS